MEKIDRDGIMQPFSTLCIILIKVIEIDEMPDGVKGSCLYWAQKTA